MQDLHCFLCRSWKTSCTWKKCFLRQPFFSVTYFSFACRCRTTRGFMHMKIQERSGQGYILGQFSKPFRTIAQMLLYYSRNSLPVKGIEHISLKKPVCEQLLWSYIIINKEKPSLLKIKKTWWKYNNYEIFKNSTLIRRKKSSNEKPRKIRENTISKLKVHLFKIIIMCQMLNFRTKKKVWNSL